MRRRGSPGSWPARTSARAARACARSRPRRRASRPAWKCGSVAGERRRPAASSRSSDMTPPRASNTAPSLLLCERCARRAIPPPRTKRDTSRPATPIGRRQESSSPVSKRPTDAASADPHGYEQPRRRCCLLTDAGAVRRSIACVPARARRLRRRSRPHAWRLDQAVARPDRGLLQAGGPVRRSVNGRRERPARRPAARRTCAAPRWAVVAD